MAQDIELMNALYLSVPAILLPKSGGGTAAFTDVSDTTATAGDVAAGTYFYTAAGVRTQGTGSGGSGSGAFVHTVEQLPGGGEHHIITGVDISDTTAEAEDVASGKYFYTADGTKTQGTASGGSSYTLLLSDEVTVSTTSTNTVELKTVYVTPTDHASCILYCEVRDKAAPRANYFYGTILQYNSTSAREITNTYRLASQVFKANASGLVKAVSTSQYGVYVVLLSRSGTNTVELSIRSRYSADYSGNIDGTYSVKIYELAYPDGSPFS